MDLVLPTPFLCYRLGYLGGGAPALLRGLTQVSLSQGLLGLQNVTLSVSEESLLGMVRCFASLSMT